jgi:methyl-accepting chemotaxis protein
VRLPALSFRQKLVGPALVAAAATLVATFVASRLSSRAGEELVRIERQHFPALELAQHLESRLARVQRKLQDAASAEDASELEAADALQQELLRAINGAPREVLDPQRAAHLSQLVSAYYRDARATTARLVHREGGDELGDALRALGTRYVTVKDALAAETARSRAAVAQGFEEARTLQRRSVAAGAIILLLAALGSAALALVLAYRVSRPLVALEAAALRIADGDLTQEIVSSSRDEVGSLAESFRRMTERLRAIVSTLKTAATELGRAAERLTEHTRAQSAILERQASNVSETSATTRELEQTSQVAANQAESVLEVARKAARMSETGHTAAERSVVGLQQIQASVQDIMGQSGQLLDHARQVGDIVETVRDLAVQSHVLSLNASIEAARAGESGKGFAVVAAEVRALAEQSGDSAGKIQKIVQDMLTAVQATRTMTENGSREMEGSVEQIRASGESLREIGGIVRETSDAALQIATAVQQQSQGVAQIALAMRDLDGGMDETVARIQVLHDSARELTDTAVRISAIADGFRV